MKRRLPWVITILSALACTGGPGAITDCAAADGVTPICGFQNPEDLAHLPGASWVAVSQFAGMQGGVGSLLAYRVADGRRLMLFPDPDARPAEGPAWGSPECPGPPDATIARNRKVL